MVNMRVGRSWQDLANELGKILDQLFEVAFKISTAKPTSKAKKRKPLSDHQYNT